MVYKVDINFSEKFEDSLESETLIDASDKNRIEDVRLKKEEWLETNSNLDNIHGYEFELDVWNFLLSLKPTLINDISREFKLDLSPYNKDKLTTYQDSKQTDIFAVFDKHIFIVECKSTINRRKKGLKNLKNEMKELKFLSKFKELRINDLFEDYVVVNMLFTDGYDLPSSENNREGLNQIKNLLNNNPSIAFFSKTYMEYIDKVREESESSEFAYKQFLGFFRSNKPDFAERDEKGNPLKSKISAFTSKFGEDTKKKSYTFSISPNEMLKISTVAHSRAKNIYTANQDNEKYYQRLLKKGRINSISSFLEESNQSFPNNILVSYRGEEALEFEPYEENFEANMIGNVPGNLSFYKCPGTFHVIDGQHRLFGYTGLDKNSEIRNEHRLIVTVFEGLKVEDEAKLFLEINNEAKAVNPALIMEIEWGGQSIMKKNLANGIIFYLRDKDDSALKNKIQQAEEGSFKLSPKNFQTALLNTKILEREEFNNINFKKKNHSWNGLLKSVQNLYDFINSLMKIIESKNPELWNTSRRKSQNPGLLRDILMGALIMIIDRIALTVIKNNPHLSRDRILSLSKPYITLLAKKLNEASNDELYGEKGLLNMEFYRARGAGASKLVGKYLISNLLKKKYPDLLYPEEKQDIAALELGVHGDIEKIRKHLKNNSDYVAEKHSKMPIRNRSRTQRGLTYHNCAKYIIENVFSMEQHYLDPWKVLIMPCYYPREGTPEEVKKANPFFNYNMQYAEQLATSGARSYQSPFNLIEGISLYNLIAQPIKHKKIKPAHNEDKEEILERVTDYIWKNLLIFEDDVELPSEKPELNDKLWQQGANYIKLFYQYRSAAGGSLHDAHYSKFRGELEDYDSLFDIYESKFKELITKVLDDIKPEGKEREEIEEILSEDFY